MRNERFERYIVVNTLIEYDHIVRLKSNRIVYKILLFLSLSLEKAKRKNRKQKERKKKSESPSTAARVFVSLFTPNKRISKSV